MLLATLHGALVDRARGRAEGHIRRSVFQREEVGEVDNGAYSLFAHAHSYFEHQAISLPWRLTESPSPCRRGKWLATSPSSSLLPWSWPSPPRALDVLFWDIQSSGPDHQRGLQAQRPSGSEAFRLRGLQALTDHPGPFMVRGRQKIADE